MWCLCVRSRRKCPVLLHDTCPMHWAAAKVSGIVRCVAHACVFGTSVGDVCRCSYISTNVPGIVRYLTQCALGLGERECPVSYDTCPMHWLSAELLSSIVRYVMPILFLALGSSAEGWCTHVKHGSSLWWGGEEYHTTR